MSRVNMENRRYLEDLTRGQIATTRSVEVKAPDIVEFALRYDPQPLHTNAELAVRTSLGGLVASGWHTASMAMRLMADARPMGDTPLIGLSVDNLQWPNPVRPGDILQARIEILSTVVSRCPS